MRVSAVISFALVALVACAACESARKNWALLIAGSTYYDNYRHQADVCHAYQILHAAGIPDEQIVVMMYDDIANSTENPFQGNIINRPDGPNVYPGVPKDYTGDDVTAKIFLAVLQGDKEAIRHLLGREGKVIDSGPDDYIFVYYADHGGPGLLGMPDEPYLKARDIINTLKKMHANKKYAKLTFYVDACESGSIFSNLLPIDIDVYAATSANSSQSSYACYWDDQRQAYLGDFFSVNWMEDTESSDIHKETLNQQFEKVRSETNTSHVERFGDFSIGALTLDQFFSNITQKSVNYRSTKSQQNKEGRQRLLENAVPSEMVAIQTLKNRITESGLNLRKRAQNEAKLAQLQKTVALTHQLIWDIARTVYSGRSETDIYDLAMKDHNNIEQWDCYEQAVDTLLAFCPGLDITRNDFALRKFYVLVNLCNVQPLFKVIGAIETATAVNRMCMQ